MITIEISLGEALDRLSILAIKGTRISDSQKRALIQQQVMNLDRKLMMYTKNVPITEELYTKLLTTNDLLWMAEDEIRTTIRNLSDRTDEAHISIASRESTLIELAKDIPRLNDIRAALKQQIDSMYGHIGEVKEYAK